MDPRVILRDSTVCILFLQTHLETDEEIKRDLKRIGSRTRGKEKNDCNWWPLSLKGRHLMEQIQHSLFFLSLSFFLSVVGCRSNSTWSEGLVWACRDTKCLSVNKHTDQSHSQTSRVLSSSLSLGIPFPPPSVCEVFSSFSFRFCLSQHGHLYVCIAFSSHSISDNHSKKKHQIFEVVPMVVIWTENYRRSLIISISSRCLLSSPGGTCWFDFKRLLARFPEQEVFWTYKNKMRTNSHWSFWTFKNKMHTNSQWRRPEVLPTTVMKEVKGDWSPPWHGNTLRIGDKSQNPSGL